MESVVFIPCLIIIERNTKQCFPSNYIKLLLNARQSISSVLDILEYVDF